MAKPTDDNGSEDYWGMSEEELRAAYAEARANFSAADLQLYTVEEEGIPAEQVIAELEDILRQAEEAKRKQE